MNERMKHLGERLSYLRQNFGLTQENVALYLGIDQSLISKIEKGERNIDSVSLEALADLYLVPVDDILEKEDLNSFSVSFRKKEYEKDDLLKLAKINRIILNQKFMDEVGSDEDQ